MSKIDFDSIRRQVEAEVASTDKRRTPAEGRTYFKWTDDMTARLVDLIDLGKDVNDIAAALQVPVEKVVSKCKTMRAKMISGTPAPKATIEEDKPAPVAAPPEDKPISAKPTQQMDRVIYGALNQLEAMIDDFEGMVRIWRHALELIELWALGLQKQIERYPQAESHFAAIGAIVAYDEIFRKEKKNAGT